MLGYVVAAAVGYGLGKRAAERDSARVGQQIENALQRSLSQYGLAVGQLVDTTTRPNTVPTASGSRRYYR